MGDRPAGILLSTLTFFVAIGVVVAGNTLASVLGYRLLVHLNKEATWTGGIKAWLNETKARIGLPKFSKARELVVSNGTKSGSGKSKVKFADPYPHGYASVPKWQDELVVDIKGEESDSTLN